MLIGIPKEIKNNENRVALTPAGVVCVCILVWFSNQKERTKLILSLC
ncbi:alanine dehydrogenase [Streptococcus pneumoniae]|nr:alanine dehydrogenase [Streptococcus pneumoniae]